MLSLILTLLYHVVCYNNFSNDDSSTGIVALILARGGSKGIKMKNIQMIDGKSLLGIALSEIKKAEIFESIWVSTDHEDIAKEAVKCKYNYRLKSFSFYSEELSIYYVKFWIKIRYFLWVLETRIPAHALSYIRTSELPKLWMNNEQNFTNKIIRGRTQMTSNYKGSGGEGWVSLWQPHAKGTFLCENFVTKGMMVD